MDGFSIVVLSILGIIVGGVSLAVFLLRSEAKNVERRAWDRERQREGNVNIRAMAHREKMRRQERDRQQAKIKKERADREQSRKAHKAKTMF